MPHSNIACCPSVCLQRKLTTLKTSVYQLFYQQSLFPTLHTLKMYLILVISVTRQTIFPMPIILQYFTADQIAIFHYVSAYQLLFDFFYKSNSVNSK